MHKPDPSFVRALKVISSDLEVTWETPLDRWVIYYTGSDGRKWRIHEVKEPDGSYRPLDNRVLEMLRRCDMSTKVQDVNYMLSEQFRKSKEFKAAERRKSIEEKIRQSKDMLPKWKKALDNADRGIFKPTQLDKKIIYSFSSQGQSQAKLLQKLGKPYLHGQPTIINP